MKLVSVIISFRNEEESIPEMVGRLEAALGQMPEDYEVIYVNDDSSDRSLEILAECNARNPRIKVINLSRRFGIEPAIFAGMAYARGDALVTIDADLQDPPELIPDLVKLWREGADVVYTVRVAREGEPWSKMFLTKIAYRIIASLASIHIPINAGDFRLLSRRVVDILQRLQEPNTYLRGLVPWVGFKRVPYHYVRKARPGGESHFGALSRSSISALFYGITGFSAMPIYAIVLIGLVVLAVASLWLLGLAVVRIFDVPIGIWPWAFAAAVWMWAGLVLAVGVVGLYVARIFRTTLARPRYLVESTVGFEKAPSIGSP
jgi:polyisoprenyl-phosphate glycosyltransferase